MRVPLSTREADFMKDTCFFFIRENHPDATFRDVFNSLTAEHKQILKNKYSDILEDEDYGKEE